MSTRKSIRMSPRIWSQSPVLRSSVIALSLRISGAGLLFVFNYLLVKLLGISDSGIFFLAMTVINMASILLLLGIDQLTLRKLSSADKKSPRQQQDIFTTSVQIVAFSALVGTAILILSSGLLARLFDQPSFAQTLIFLSLALCPLGVSALIGESLRAKGRFTSSVFITTNCLYVLIIPLLVILKFQGSASLGTVSFTFFVSSVLYLVASGLLSKRSRLIASFRTILQPQRVTVYSETVRESKHLLWSSMLYLSMGWIDVLIVGLFLPPAQVSVYAIASRIAKLMTFPLFAVNTIIAPRIARYNSLGNLVRLNTEAQKSTLLSILFSLPLFVLFVAFPAIFLGIFGSEFTSGSNLLRLLVVGQAINSCTGAVIVILTMMKFEKQVNLISFSGLAVQLLLGLILTPAYGAIGMAIGTVVGMALLNIWGAFILFYKHKVSIIPSPQFIRQLLGHD